MPRTDRNGLTRRELLQSAALIAVGGVAAGVLSSCTSAPPAPTSAPAAPSKPAAPAATSAPAPAAPATSSAAQAKPAVTIRVAHGATLTLAPFYLAVANKFYEKWNVNVTENPIPASPAMLEGIAADQLDTATAIALTAVPAFDKGLPVNMIFSYGYGGDRYAICARADAGIKTVKDLEGKRVAVTFGVTQHRLLIVAMKAAGSDISKVQLFNMSGPDMASAFAGKSIDAAAGLDPDVSNWIEKGLAVVIERGGKYVSGAGTMLMRRNLIEKYPEDVYRFTLAIMDVFHWIRTTGPTSDEVVGQVATLLKSNKELTRGSMLYNVMDPRLTGYIKDEIRREGEFVISQGNMKAMPDLNKFIVPTFIERAQKEHPELFDDIPAYLKKMNVPPEAMQ